MELPTEAFPPLVPSSLRADKRTAKTRPQPTQSARRKQKTVGQKKKTITGDTEPNVHPAMKGQFQDHSLMLFQDFTPSNLVDVLQHINSYSTPSALDMGLTCPHANELLTTRNSIWKGAIDKDYDTSKALPGISTYHLYHFICTYKGFEGRYIFNKIAHYTHRMFGPDEDFRHIEIELMEIDVTSTGFTISFLKRDEYGLTLLKCQPFLEAKLVPNDRNGTELQLFSGGQANPYACKQRKWQRKDYITQQCTLEEWLFTCSSLYSAIVEMIDGRHLVQLHLDGRKHLDPIYQSPEDAWPVALLKPGVFQTEVFEVQVTVCYSGRFMIVEQVINLARDPFSFTILLDLSTAATVGNGEPNNFTRKQFLDLEKNTNGDPLKMTEQKMLDLTDVYTSPIPYVTWYTRVNRQDKDLRMKVLVVNSSAFIVVNNRGQWNMRRQNVTE